MPKKIYTRNNKGFNNTYIYLIVPFLTICILSACLYINPHFRSSIQQTNRSNTLKLVLSQKDGIQRADYYDANGMLTYASDKHFASRIRTTKNKTVLEEYFDEEGKAAKQNLGHYAVLYEYNDDEQIVKTSYLGHEHVPVMISSGYSLIIYQYNDNGKIAKESYYDIDGKPAKTRFFGYECYREYDENGDNVKTIYLDEIGKPIVTEQGFAIRKMAYYKDDISKGKIKSDFFFDNNEIPTKSIAGQYGTYYEYDQYGRIKKKTSIDQYGKPMINAYGYCSVIFTYYNDDTVETEQYYDTNDNPIQLSEGQYGLKHIEGKTIYLNKQGNEQINLKTLLYNSEWIVILGAIMMIIVSSLVGKKINISLLFLYMCFVLYMTIYRKDSIGIEQIITAFRSYKDFFTDSSVRRGIVFNILLFMPIGAILFRLLPFKILVIILVIISVAIETIQYFAIIGECSLDDVISNVFGGIIGFMFSKCIYTFKVEKAENT